MSNLSKSITRSEKRTYIFCLRFRRLHTSRITSTVRSVSYILYSSFGYDARLVYDIHYIHRSWMERRPEKLIPMIPNSFPILLSVRTARSIINLSPKSLLFLFFFRAPSPSHRERFGRGPFINRKSSGRVNINLSPFKPTGAQPRRFYTTHAVFFPPSRTRVVLHLCRAVNPSRSFRERTYIHNVCCSTSYRWLT